MLSHGWVIIGGGKWKKQESVWHPFCWYKCHYHKHCWAFFIGHRQEKQKAKCLVELAVYRCKKYRIQVFQVFLFVSGARVVLRP